MNNKNGLFSSDDWEKHTPPPDKVECEHETPTTPEENPVYTLLLYISSTTTHHWKRRSIFSILLYISSGVLFYTYEEGWGIIDCVYFEMVLVTTVGYGDLAPSTDYSKAFTMVFALFGIAVLGHALLNLVESFMDTQHSMQQDMNARRIRSASRAASFVVSSSYNNPFPSTPREQLHHPVYFSTDNKALLWACVPIVASITFGMVIGYLEEGSVLDIIYTTIITITTIGLGDIHPSSTLARALSIVYLPVAVISVAHGISTLSAHLVKKRLHIRASQPICMGELMAMDADGDGKVSTVEYLSYMLMKLNMARKEDIDAILGTFHTLDTAQRGYLDRNDVGALHEHMQSLPN